MEQLGGIKLGIGNNSHPKALPPAGRQQVGKIGHRRYRIGNQLKFHCKLADAIFITGLQHLLPDPVDLDFGKIDAQPLYGFNCGDAIL